MGTNYYAKIKGEQCSACGRHDEETLHIGKSSGGWVFALHRIPDRGLVDWPSWWEFLRSSRAEVEDEYGRSVDIEGLAIVVCCRVPSPKVSALLCVTGGGRRRCGEPTWEMIDGEFS